MNKKQKECDHTFTRRPSLGVGALEICMKCGISMSEYKSSFFNPDQPEIVTTSLAIRKKYTPALLEADIDGINAHLKPIRLDRGKRYGSPDDTLSNVRECDPERSWRGAYVSTVECTNRLRNMFMTPCCEQDINDFENASDDLINYAFYIKILGRQKFQEIEERGE